MKLKKLKKTDHGWYVELPSELVLSKHALETLYAPVKGYYAIARGICPYAHFHVPADRNESIAIDLVREANMPENADITRFVNTYARVVRWFLHSRQTLEDYTLFLEMYMPFIAGDVRNASILNVEDIRILCTYAKRHAFEKVGKTYVRKKKAVPSKSTPFSS